MALAETAELAVKLSLGGNFQSQMSKVNRGLRDFDRNSSRAYRAGQQIGTGIKRGLALAAGAAGLVATQVAFGLDSLIELEKQTAQTNAVIKSTGGVAGITAEQVGKLAEKYESLNATVGDETIREAQNLILTFTNIREDAFEPTLAAILDMNAAMGKGPEGLQSTVLQVGKAMNDPIKGLTALRRVGVAFTKEQEKKIKTLAEEGKLYEAQQLILAELNKEFGGSFAAQGDTTAGAVAKFGDAITDLQRALATALLPTVRNIADAMSEFLSDPAVVKGAQDLGREIGNLFSKDNIKAGAKAVGDAFDLIRSAAPVIKSTLGTVGTVLKGAFDAFSALPAPIQQLLVGAVAVNKLTGGLVTNIAGGVFGALKAMTVQAGVVNVTGGVVSGGGAGVGAAGAAGKGIAGKVGAAISVAAIVAGVAGVIQTQQEQSSNSTVQARAIQEGLNSSVAGKTLPELKVALAGVNQGIADIQSNPLYALVQGEALTALQEMRGSIADQIKKTEAVRHMVDASKDDTVAKLRDAEAAVNKTTRAAQETKREAGRGLAIVNQSTRSGSASVVSAIYANRPIINVDVKVSDRGTSVRTRYGKSDGSRELDDPSLPFGGDKL